ncbi:MAG: site-specific integrase [Gammaproteobacteria bacterium]|nr:MAG: site-specific integrase [Gammaproteobacteria bacterium]
MRRQRSGKKGSPPMYRTIGNTVVEWEGADPFIFTMTQEVGARDRRVSKTIAIDFTELEKGFTEEFLCHLKEHLMERCNRVKLASIRTEQINLQNLLAKVIAHKLFETKVAVIDEGFLLCLAAEKDNFTALQLKYLRTAFSNNPYSPLFAKGLEVSDFPRLTNRKGSHGQMIDNILGKALARSTAAYILDVCDTAYAGGSMDIDHYSFVHLAFAVFVRPNSYRQIRVGDLTIATSGQYFIDIVTSKTGEEYPSKITFGINEHLGVLLTKQRQHVIEKYGHLVAQEDIKKLALFPARRLAKDHLQWQSEYANEHFGMFESGAAFGNSYPKAIKNQHFNDDKFTLGSNVLRHTVGTLLAQTGASAKTLQAVLKHSSNMVCRAYVDIAFNGLMEDLSEAMRPAFAEHLPALINFCSCDDRVIPEKQIQSWNQDTRKLENTGECGRSIACANAPIVCYGCVRFIPCWDADHGINLRIVENEIEDMSKRGKPFQHMVDRARSAKNKIILVMNAADRHRQALQTGVQA